LKYWVWLPGVLLWNDVIFYCETFARTFVRMEVGRMTV